VDRERVSVYDYPLRHPHGVSADVEFAQTPPGKGPWSPGFAIHNTWLTAATCAMDSNRKTNRRPHSDDGSPLIDSQAKYRPMPDTLWTLIREAQAGNQESIDRFYRRYATPAFCYLRRALNGNVELAKDLTQNALGRLLTRRPLEGVEMGRSRFRSYLFSVLEKEKDSYFRREHAKKRRPPGGIVSLEKILERAGPYLDPADVATPEDAFVRQEAREIVNAAARRVQADCQRDGLGDHFQMFALKYLQEPGLSWPEIGKQFGLSPDGARNQAMTAGTRLAKALLEEAGAGGATKHQARQQIADLLQWLQRPRDCRERRR